MTYAQSPAEEPWPELPQPAPRFIRSIELAALPTAIPCTRLFVDSTLRLWGARFVQADAELLAVELVRHSLQTVGMTNHVPLYQLEHIAILHLRLLGFERTIGIEVWDSATQPAQPPVGCQVVGTASELVLPGAWDHLFATDGTV